MRSVNCARASVLAFAVLCNSSLSLSANAASSAPINWTPTLTGAYPITDELFVRSMDDTDAIHVVVSLNIPNKPALDAFVASLSEHTWATRPLSRTDVLTKYAPSTAQTQAVINYLSSAGFKNIVVADNRLFVSGDGTAGTARAAFNTDLGYFSRNGKVGFANTAPAQVPASIGDGVLAVLGLQSLDSFHTSITLSTPFISAVTVSETQSTVSAMAGITPIEFESAYDTNGIPSGSQTDVGIISDGDLTQSIQDLHTFEQGYSLPTINPIVVPTGPASTDTSEVTEWDVDSQSIQSTAVQVHQMYFYDAPSLGYTDVFMAFNKAVSDDIAKIINVSLIYCETDSGVVASGDQIFEVAVAQGQTFSAASGDHGANECGYSAGNGTYASQAGAGYPASSPYVVAVGATALVVNSDGSYNSETAWMFGGGSPSLVEPKPAWQENFVPGNYRGVPDIAFDGSFTTQASIYYGGIFNTAGGTSLSSPLFVGAWARIETAHQTALQFAAPYFYEVASTSSASVYHDVVSGYNGGYSAGPGWDFTTGFGSFDVTAMNTAVSLFQPGTATVSSSIVPIVDYVLSDN